MGNKFSLLFNWACQSWLGREKWAHMETNLVSSKFETLRRSIFFNISVDAYGKWDSERKGEEEIAEVEIEESEEPEILNAS